MSLKYDMYFINTISAQGKVKEMTLTAVGHDRKVKCLSRHPLDNNEHF